MNLKTKFLTRGQKMTNAKHNNPPDPIDEATAPFAGAIAEAESWADGELVSTKGQMDAVDKLTADIKAAIKAVKDGEDSAAKPMYDQWKSEKARWKPTIDDLERIKVCLIAAVAPFKANIANELAEKKRMAFVEAQKKVEAAAKAAAEANSANLADARRAEELQAEAVDAINAARQSETVKGMRKVTKFEVTDHRKALHWIAANRKEDMTAFIDEYVRRHHKNNDIDGVRVWTEKEAF